MATRKKKAPPARQSKSVASGQAQAAKTQNGSVHGQGPQSLIGTPTSEEVRIRAYLLYLERGATHGQDLEDWFVAEKLLSESRVKPA